MKTMRSVVRLGGMTLCAAMVGWVMLGETARASCTDANATATLREAVEASCPCAAATSHGGYMGCAKGVIGQAVAQGQVSAACGAAVKKCISRSTCGRPGAVTCCRTTATGKTKCSVKSSAAKCSAPPGGTSVCASGFASCCDACDSGGCNPTPTATPSTTPTATETATATPSATPTATIPPICQSMIGLPAIAEVPFKIAPGSAQCGGASLSNPAPAPPFSGSIADGGGTTLGDLGVGCLYTGTFPGLTIPDGAVSTLNVVGVSLVPPSVTVGGSAGHGPQDCTLGAGPARKCINGSGGLDGMGQCNNDVDCQPGNLGACALEAHCYFGPPMPVPTGAMSACVVNTFLTDLCGSVDLLPPQANLATVLQSRVYFTSNPDNPCPRCESGTCNGGDRVGQPCTAVGSLQTSLDCPPPANRYFGTITVVLPSLTTGTSSLSAGDGLFCAGQDSPGAFGVSAARSVSEAGVPPGGSTNALNLQLASTFCVPATGTPIDFFAGLPAAGGLSAAGQLDLSSVLP